MTSSTLTFRSSLRKRGDISNISSGDGGAGRLAVHQVLKLIGDRSTVQYALKKTGEIFRLKIKASFPHRDIHLSPRIEESRKCQSIGCIFSHFSIFSLYFFLSLSHSQKSISRMNSHTAARTAVSKNNTPKKPERKSNLIMISFIAYIVKAIPIAASAHAKTA